MKTYERTQLPERTKPARGESVKFHDGMIVTADDLDVAEHYPVSMLTAVLRAYLGCGVVCGLTLTTKENAPWVVCVARGMAIDCQGHPVELCAPVELDLSPEACSCDEPPDQVYVLVRRLTSEEAPSDPCGCDVDAPAFDCRRIRDHVLVKAFSAIDLEQLTDCVCRRRTSEKPPSMCDALTTCPDCACGDSWILLGRVNLDKNKGVTGVDLSARRWVKPTEAVCTTVTDRLERLEAKIAELSPPVTEQTPKAAGPSPATA
ncbi:hypothetical protein [Actinoplanes sp. NPDC048796]|uniref:hypothetical protein n=1 Tax=unclassified Actinoplanes TaxID=2626549 RepID=UPI0033CEDC0A